MYRMGQEEIDAVARIIHSKWMFKVGGPNVSETCLFEEELREKLQCEHAILMTSGHAALASALVGMGIGPGDEVIVPAYTYIATAVAVLSVGAIPIIAEVNETLTLDADDVEKKITRRTKAIIPVHIQGFPCDMDALLAVAKKHRIMVLEDACQADGGSYKGKRLGTIGDAGALSFNQYKIISAGEGGALLTDNRLIFERAAIYHDSSAIAYFGKQLDSFSTEVFCGSEYRTNNLTAAIMRVQLSRLDGILCDLRKNKKYIMTALQNECIFVPSNDPEGDCGTTLAFRFDTEEKAIDFAAKCDGTRPIDTGKHVYTNWDSVMNMRGAFHEYFNPYNMPQNKKPNYTQDMCPKTLDYLKRTVYIAVNPDMTTTELDACIAAYREILA